VSAAAVFVAACEFGVDGVVELAVGGIARVERGVAAVVGGEFLLDDVGLDGDAKVVGLCGEVCRCVIIYAVDFEGAVADVAPKDGDETILMCFMEHVGDIADLFFGFIGTKVDRRADSSCAHLPALFNVAKWNLVEGVGIGHEFIVVELNEVWDFVCVFAGGCAEDAEGRCDSVAAAFDREFDD